MAFISFSLEEIQVVAAKCLYLMCDSALGSMKCLAERFFPTCFFPCNRYRFAEIRYHRPEETHKGRTVPAHVETVVLFFPDVWHCLPTRSEWETLSRGYKQQLAEKLQGERKEADGEQALNANPFFYFCFSQAQEHRHKTHTTRYTTNIPRRNITGNNDWQTSFQQCRIFFVCSFNVS